MTKGRTKYTVNIVFELIMFSSALACKAQFLVSCRSRLARVCRMRAADVSGTINRPMPPKKAAMIRVIQLIQRQPRWLSVTKPPTIGPWMHVSSALLG